MKNFLIAICTCDKNLTRTPHLEKIYKQYNFNNYFFYFGSGIPLSSKYISLNTSDCYSNLTLKTYEMFKYVQNLDFDYLVKVDDDTFLDINQLSKLNLKNYDYIGSSSSLSKHLENFNYYKEYLISKSLKKNIDFSYTSKLTDFPYIMGNFCIFKKELILKILKFCLKDRLHIEIPQEDISVGYVCSKVNSNLLDIGENIPFYHITKNISYHPVPFMLQNLFFKSESKKQRLSLCKSFLLTNKYFQTK